MSLPPIVIGTSCDAARFLCGIGISFIRCQFFRTGYKDVFDALVSKRVYKEKMSVDEAYNVLKEESGKHFDPQIVDIFINIRYDVEEYVKKIEEGI